MRNLLGIIYFLSTGIGKAIVILFILACILPEWCGKIIAGVIVLLFFAFIIKCIVFMFSIFKE